MGGNELTRFRYFIEQDTLEARRLVRLWEQLQHELEHPTDGFLSHSAESAGVLDHPLVQNKLVVAEKGQKLLTAQIEEYRVEKLKVDFLRLPLNDTTMTAFIQCGGSTGSGSQFIGALPFSLSETTSTQ